MSELSSGLILYGIAMYELMPEYKCFKQETWVRCKSTDIC